MSLITLHSDISEISSKTIENAYIRNNFKDGIQIKPGDTISLVSLTLTKSEGITITDSNDTIVFRIGGRTQWNQRTVTLGHGTYDADGIAKEMEFQLNAAVMLGVFKQSATSTTDGFRVLHTAPVAPATNSTLTITMIPQTVAALPNANSWTHYNNDVDSNVEMPGGIEENFDSGTSHGLITLGFGSVGQNDGHPCPYDDQSANSLYIGSRGIFANGGVHEVVSGAVYGLKYRNGLTFSADAAGTVCNGEKAGAPGWLGVGSSVTCKIENAPGAGGYTDWSYMVTFTAPVRKFPIGDPDTATATVAYLWLVRENSGTALDAENGKMYMGFDGTANASLSASWDAPYNTWWYDNVNKSINAYEDGAFRPSDGRDLEDPADQPYPFFTQPAVAGPPAVAAGIQSTLDIIGNTPVVCALVNNDLATGLVKHPAGSIDTAWADNDPAKPGFNVHAQLVPSADGSQTPEFSLTVLQGLAGAYPDGVWRQPLEIVAPTRVDQTNPRDPTNADILPGFVKGNAIRVQIEITAIRGIIVSLSHKSDWRDQTNPWSAPHIVAQNSGAISPGQNAWNKVLKESDFPLRPMTCACSYVHYGQDRTIAPASNYNGLLTSDCGWQGKYDEVEYENTLGVASTYGGEEADADLDALAPGLGAPGPITLSQMWKFGLVTAGTSNTTQVPAEDLIPNTANVNLTLGFTPSRIEVAANPITPIVSTGVLLGSVVNPNLSVELQDFRIKGYNGKTSDTAKCIAVIPKEELHTGDDSGTLHYSAPFPIPIDLNVPHETNQYSMTAMLRDSDGKVIEDLSYPTQIVLLHERSALAKQEDMMERVLEKISLKQSNRNSSQISQIGDGNPITRAV